MSSNDYDTYVEVTTRRQLYNAVRAVPYEGRTLIIFKSSRGSVTKYKFNGCVKETEWAFNKRLATISNNILRRSPACVW